MEAQEEAVTVMSKDHTQQILIKRKRTKRQRLTASLMLSMSSSSSSIEGLERATASISPTTSTNLTQSTTTLEEQREKYDEEEDDEDMANCLMLLAQGGHVPHQTPKKSPIVASTNTVYECKTCDRSFHSFQALGGHRASHKKFKSANYNLDLQHDHQDHRQEKMKTLALMEDGVELQSHRRDHHNTTLSLQITNPTTTRQLSNGKVHECSICGAEFSSGQALGGHMRRHRSFPPPTTSTTTTTTTTTMSLGTSNKSDDHTPQQAKKLPRKNGLSLDLNLPASSEDEHHHHRESKFAFVSSKQVLAFSASTTAAAPLVDCQY